MPDQALLRVSGFHTLHDQICTFILLIAANDLVFSIFLICSKQCEELENVHDLPRLHHICNTDLDIGQRSFDLVVRCVPRTPHIDRHTDRTVAEHLTLGRKVEYICYEHRCNALLVVCDVTCTIKPCDRTADGRFQLTNSNREAVDEQNNIKAVSAFLHRVNPLIRHDILVQSEVLLRHCAKETDRNHSAVLAKRIRVFLKNELFEDFILCDEIMRLHRENQCTQLINDSIRS